MTILETEHDWDMAMAELEIGGGLLQPVITQVMDEALDGVIQRDVFDQIIDDAQVPASRLRDLKILLTGLGIEIVDSADITEGDVEEVQAGWDVDGLSHFISSVAHRVLTQAEEFDLGVAVQQGELASDVLAEHPEISDEARQDLERRIRSGQEAAREFVLHNLLLVRSIASKYEPQLGPAMSLDDLVDEGFVGLAHAVTKFDPYKGFKFSTYATWWIRQALQRAIANQNSVIRLPVHAHDLAKRIRRIRADFVHSEGREPSVSEIAGRADATEEQVASIVMHLAPVASLDRPAGIGTASLGDFISDESALSPENWALDLDRKEAVGRALANLPERMQQILVARFGLDGAKPMTLEEVGRMFDVTRERVRQLEKKALKALENGQAGAELREMLGE